jgi:hypothetical protein
MAKIGRKLQEMAKNGKWREMAKKCTISCHFSFFGITCHFLPFSIFCHFLPFLSIFCRFLPFVPFFANSCHFDVVEDFEEMARNGKKWQEMARNGMKWQKMAKLAKIAKYGKK